MFGRSFLIKNDLVSSFLRVSIQEWEPLLLEGLDYNFNLISWFTFSLYGCPRTSLGIIHYWTSPISPRFSASDYSEGLRILHSEPLYH